MQSAIYIIKNLSEQSPAETLKLLHTSKLSLSYHKNLTVVKTAVKFLQNISKYSLNDEDHALATKLILNLLANADVDVRYTTYVECHALIKSILGVEYNKLSWENLTFLFEPNVLTEIISHGATSEDSRVITILFNQTFSFKYSITNCYKIIVCAVFDFIIYFYLDLIYRSMRCRETCWCLY